MQQKFRHQQFLIVAALAKMNLFELFKQKLGWEELVI